MEKRAVILAGGRGTRLLPYTVTLPKPLVPVGDWPVMEIVIRQLARAGFARITLAVNHQAELIRAYFGDGAKWSVAIDYSLETTPLGTMGPLRLIRDLPQHFLVMNRDILIDVGVLDVDGTNVLTGFHEKPKIPYLVSMGVYCVARDVLAWVPDGRAFGFDQLMLALLADGRKVQVAPYAGFWLDIGRPSDYQFAVEQWDELRPRLLPA